MAMSISPTKRIMIVGPSTVGKTSIVKALADASCQRMDFAEYSGIQPISTYDMQQCDILYRFIDIKDPESVMSNTAGETDIQKYFAQVIDEIHAGVCLILFVFRSGSVHQSCWDVYRLFVKILCKNQLPVVGVVTHCENEEIMSEYIDTNRDNYKRNGLKFNDVKGTCFVRGGRLEKFCRQLREESARDVWKMIEIHSLPQNTNALSQSSPVGISQQLKSLFSSLPSAIFRRGKSNNEHPAAETFLSHDSKASSNNRMDVQPDGATRSEYESSVLSSHHTDKRSTTAEQKSAPEYLSLSFKLDTVLTFTGNHTLLTNEHQKKISTWLSNKYNVARLIFKAARGSNLTAATFHNICDNKGSTIIVMKTIGGYLFGGFTQSSWSSQSIHIYDREAALFTLKNPCGLNEMWYPTDNKSKESNITHMREQGPIFGAGTCDIIVSSDKKGHLDSVIIHFPDRFVDLSNRGAKTFTGSTSNKLMDLEVFECIASPLIHR